MTVSQLLARHRRLHAAVNRPDATTELLTEFVDVCNALGDAGHVFSPREGVDYDDDNDYRTDRGIARVWGEL